MRLLIPVKRVLDYNVKPRTKADGSGVDLTNAKMSINPFDEIAVEAGLRLKEAGQASELVVVTVGPSKAQETLRTALAMGADRAIHIETTDAIEPLGVAKLLKAVALEEKPDLIILGKQAIDGDCNQTGQMLAAILGWGQGTFASRIVVADGKAQVTREVDSGLESIELALPAVITADLRLNEPRYASLPNIMKAKSKPLAVRTTDEFGVDIAQRHSLLRVSEPQSRKAGIIVESVAELAEKIKQTGVLA